MNWQIGDRCVVTFNDDVRIPGVVHSIDRSSNGGIHQVKVVFDDPMQYGGMGQGWFRPETLRWQHEPPAEPDRHDIT